MADNTVTLRGTIGQEPERKTTPKGDVLNFTMAVSDRIRNQDGSWRDGHTSWYRVNVWSEALMRNASVSLHKGQRVLVQGTLKVSDYPNQSGGTSKSIELRATAIGHDLTFGVSSFSKGGTPAIAPARELVTVGAPAEQQAQPSWSTPMADSTVAPPAPQGASDGWATTYVDDDDPTPF